jgi:hypothetical protein
LIELHNDLTGIRRKVFETHVVFPASHEPLQGPSRAEMPMMILDAPI